MNSSNKIRVWTMGRKPSYNSELTPLPIVMSFAHAKAPPTCRFGAKHGNDVSSSFVKRKTFYTYIVVVLKPD